jgi:hypothetical protein
MDELDYGLGGPALCETRSGERESDHVAALIHGGAAPPTPTNLAPYQVGREGVRGEGPPSPRQFFRSGYGSRETCIDLLARPTGNEVHTRKC